jgi:sugar transferase (PEP-CTERM/EpsH1 system associated)
MNILFLTPRLPLPADTGAKIRTFNLLKNIAVENKVTLLSFYFAENNQAVEQIKNLGIELHLVKARERIKPTKIFSRRPLSIAKYRSEEFKQKLRELLSNTKFDLVHFDHIHMGQYVADVKGLPTVLDEHNVEFLILKRCADIEKSLVIKMLFKSQAKKMARFEGKLAIQFSRCLTVSENDKKNLLELAKYNAYVEVIPNGVDTEYFNTRDEGRETKDDSHGTPYAVRDTKLDTALVFTGSMDWLPNSDAVLYFCKDILPLIWQKNAEVKFYVVGKNPAKEILRLARADSRIVVTGQVPDVRPYLAQAKVFVCPIRIGGGTRLKILEAMSMEKTVVSTTVGAEGISYTAEKNIVIKDTPKAFSQAVLDLLESESQRKQLGQEARIFVQSNYDWSIITNKLLAVYRSVLN